MKGNIRCKVVWCVWGINEVREWEQSLQEVGKVEDGLYQGFGRLWVGIWNLFYMRGGIIGNLRKDYFGCFMENGKSGSWESRR